MVLVTFRRPPHLFRSREAFPLLGVVGLDVRSAFEIAEVGDIAEAACLRGVVVVVVEF